MRMFVRKRKQSYKRKRKEDGAPRRALSGYNLFIKERFEELSRENEKALNSDDKDVTMQRVPPKNLVTRTGNEWKALAPEVKAQYDER
jgi:HMG-box domain